MTNLYHISLLFTNSKSSDNFCRCKNKRHFFNVNICTCFNFREILTSVQSHLRKEGVSGTFFRHYNGNRKWCVICTAPYSSMQCKLRQRIEQPKYEANQQKKSIQRNGTEKWAVGIQNPTGPTQIQIAKYCCNISLPIGIYAYHVAVGYSLPVDRRQLFKFRGNAHCQF